MTNYLLTNMTHTRQLITTIALTATTLLSAQPNYAPDIQKERLGRGLVCLRDGDSIALSWRLLDDEKKVSFDVYQEGKQLNSNGL